MRCHYTLSCSTIKAQSDGDLSLGIFVQLDKPERVCLVAVQSLSEAAVKITTKLGLLKLWGDQIYCSWRHVTAPGTKKKSN